MAQQSEITRKHKSLLALFALLDSYLGHGRMLECALIFVKLQYAAILLLIPPKDVLFLAFSDLHMQTWVLAIPFIACSIPQFIGLSLNIMGYSISRWFRIVGASIGMGIWTFILTKNMVLGYVASQINPWLFMAILGSAIIIRKGVLNLPRPGAAGAA